MRSRSALEPAGVALGAAAEDEEPGEQPQDEAELDEQPQDEAEGDEAVVVDEPQAELEGDETVAAAVSSEQPADSDQPEEIEPELAEADETATDESSE